MDITLPTEESEVPNFGFASDATTIPEEKVPTYISEPTPTKFCSNCGVVLTDDSSICPSCGEPID